MKEILDMTYEFLLSCLIIGGGFYGLYTGQGDATFIVSLMTLVATFWFQKRATAATVDTTIKTLMTQPPQSPTQNNQATLGQTAEVAPGVNQNPAQTNPTNPPTIGGNNI